MKYTIKDMIILALEGAKAYFECQILFSRKKNDLKRNIPRNLKQEFYYALNQTIV